MKRKLGSHPGWWRVLARRYTVARADGAHGGYAGVISLYSFQRVAEPLWKPLAGQPALLADDGFAWLQFYPAHTGMIEMEAYSVTAMIAPDGAIAQWYIDICAGIGLTPEGIPWHDDLYLDLVTTGRGDVEVLDERELDEALAAGAITPEEHQAAWRGVHILAPHVRRTALPEMRAVQRAFTALRALERGERPAGFDLLYHCP